MVYLVYYKLRFIQCYNVKILLNKLLYEFHKLQLFMINWLRKVALCKCLLNFDPSRNSKYENFKIAEIDFVVQEITIYSMKTIKKAKNKILNTQGDL